MQTADGRNKVGLEDGKEGNCPQNNRPLDSEMVDPIVTFWLLHSLARKEIVW